MKASDAAERVIAAAPRTLLDIGSGQGKQAAVFRSHGINVTTLDSHTKADIKAVWPVETEQTYDCVWAAHCLEHSENHGLFIRAMMEACKPGGIIAITVPPCKPNLVGGHLTLWTPALLVYNLVRAGLDCRFAEVGVYHYNISVLVKNCQHDFTEWIYDNGEINKIAHLFPWPVKQNDSGHGNVNWHQRITT